MPTPRPGDGGLTFGFGQVLPIATMYLAPWVYPQVTPQAAPGTALGDSEPAAGWAKVGLMKDDMFNLEDGTPDVVEYLRGFRQRYYGEVIRKAGRRTITAVIQEVEPASLAELLGPLSDYSATGGSPATNQVLNVGTTEQVDKSLLIVFQDALTSAEFQIYSPHVISRFQFKKDAEFMTVDLTLKLITYKTAGNLYKDMTYYAFNIA